MGSQKFRSTGLIEVGNIVTIDDPWAEPGQYAGEWMVISIRNVIDVKLEAVNSNVSITHYMPFLRKVIT